MMQQKLYEWIKHPEYLNRETLYELRTLLARYPYFQTARLLYLKNLFLLHDVAFGEELRKAALYVSDRKTLFYLVEGERFSRKALEKQVAVEPEPGLDRTMTLIDAFLSTLPQEEEPVYGRAIPMEATSDYTSYLMNYTEESEEEAPELKGQNLIDEFLEKTEESPMLPVGPEEETDKGEEQPEEKTSEEEFEENMDDESCFTETLAKIYIKQQRYSKALEIIRKLNLKNPKKNAYFADQIRFLEKLIINAKSK